MVDGSSAGRPSRQPLIAAPGEIVWRHFELPAEPASGRVRVRTLVSLISPGTEMRLYRGETMPSAVWNSMAELHRFTPHGLPLPRPMASGDDRFPVSIGYNDVAEIEALGEDVEGLAVGQRVFVMGRHAEAFDVEAWEVVPIPDRLSDEEAAPSYIPTLGLHALRRIAWKPGERLAVIGLGLVGLAAALIADACGAELICVEADESRRSLAASVLPAARILDPAAAPGPDDPRDVPAVIEAAGGEPALRHAMSIAAEGARIAVLALHPEPLGSILADAFYGRELALVSTSNDPYAPAGSSGRRGFTIQENVGFVLGLMAGGRLSLEGLRSGVFPAGTIDSVYAAISSGRDRSLVGALLDWRGENQIPEPGPREPGSTAVISQSTEGVANA